MKRKNDSSGKNSNPLKKRKQTTQNSTCTITINETSISFDNNHELPILPLELWIIIFDYLLLHNLANVKLVCKAFYIFINNTARLKIHANPLLKELYRKISQNTVLLNELIFKPLAKKKNQSISAEMYRHELNHCWNDIFAILSKIAEILREVKDLTNTQLIEKLASSSYDQRTFRFIILLSKPLYAKFPPYSYCRPFPEPKDLFSIYIKKDTPETLYYFLCSDELQTHFIMHYQQLNDFFTSINHLNDAVSRVICAMGGLLQDIVSYGTESYSNRMLQPMLWCLQNRHSLSSEFSDYVSATYAKHQKPKHKLILFDYIIHGINNKGYVDISHYQDYDGKYAKMIIDFYIEALQIPCFCEEISSATLQNIKQELDNQEINQIIEQSTLLLEKLQDGLSLDG